MRTHSYRPATIAVATGEELQVDHGIPSVVPQRGRGAQEIAVRQPAFADAGIELEQVGGKPRQITVKLQMSLVVRRGLQVRCAAPGRGGVGRGVGRSGENRACSGGDHERRRAADGPRSTRKRKRRPVIRGGARRRIGTGGDFSPVCPPG